MIRATDDMKETSHPRPWRKGPGSFYHQNRGTFYIIKDKLTGFSVTCTSLPEGAGKIRDKIREQKITFNR